MGDPGRVLGRVDPHRGRCGPGDDEADREPAHHAKLRGILDVRILFLGAPGVGKGTQAERVGEALGIPHISTGEMFRRHVGSRTSLGLRVEEILSRGDLVPDVLTVEMMLERLRDPDTVNGYILDGFPRNLAQVHALDGAIGDYALDAVVVLEASDEVLTERILARGRTDDTGASVSNRLEVYERETAPLIHVYRERGLVLRVNGIGEIEEITAKILTALAAL
ncbi:MAG: adenylate kinase [Acidimicrobiia bacterium]|nr:adenylate kinase [Acidimicrobiia bacterium]MYF84833.1 adenylate kinase [Acidimicrobiia bacterium]